MTDEIIKMAERVCAGREFTDKRLEEEEHAVNSCVSWRKTFLADLWIEVWGEDCDDGILVQISSGEFEATATLIEVHDETALASIIDKALALLETVRAFREPGE